MVPSIVKDVFSTKFASVNQEDTLSACLSLLKGGSTAVLVVVNSKGKYVGVIAYRWIVRSRNNPATTKVETLMRSAPTVSLQDSLSKVARLMITSGVNQLPVFSGEKLAGIVSADAVIQTSPAKSNYSNMNHQQRYWAHSIARNLLLYYR